MKKKIIITLDDFRVVSIDAHLVAHDRAEYYSKNDTDTSYQEEYDYSIGDNFELVDWLFNNMDWFELSLTLEPSKFKPFSECEVRGAEVQEVK